MVTAVRWLRSIGLAAMAMCLVVGWWGCETRPGTGQEEIALDGSGGADAISPESGQEQAGGDGSVDSSPDRQAQEPAQEGVPEKVGEQLPEPTPDGNQCQIPSQVSAPGAVRTGRGWVAGVQEQSGSVWAYKGIPYAAPPVGGLRWRPPTPHACWQDVRDAKAFGPSCIQYDTTAKSLVGVEDCLSLNVWRPSGATPESPKAVIVFIHGGGNVQGASGQALPGGKPIYNGANIAARGDVVVVSMNYRLGVLGFLALSGLSQESAQKVSGNYGILDQIFALQWVQTNIKAFGGDPGKVMIFGESAGAVNTCVHMASPLSKGLFHRALMQSGACVSSTTLQAAEGAGSQRVQRSSCKDASDVLGCLRGMDAKKLLTEFPGSVNVGKLVGSDALEAYAPVVDGWVLKQSPIETIKAKAHNDVPFVVGSNLDEMDNLLTTPIPSAQAYEGLVRSLLKAARTEDVDALLKLYDVTTYATPRAAMVDLMTDATFTCTAISAAATAAAAASRPHVWRYFFQRRATTPRGPIAASHGIELLYVFHTLTDIPGFVPAKEDTELAAAMIDYWTRLAKTGDPNGATGRVAWTAYDPSKDNALLLDASIKMQDGVRLDRCQLWEKVLSAIVP